MPLPHANPHLPANLREVCDILACGLLRLRSRAAAREAPPPVDSGDIRLHFQARQRVHANPKRKGIA